MKRHPFILYPALAVLLFLGVLTPQFAQHTFANPPSPGLERRANTNPNPAGYTINVHVSSSEIERGFQVLNVVIDGKKYELQSELALGRLLNLGDYNAKLVKDEHKTTYDSVQVYEFLFPDNKTRQFDLIGQTE
jgi:hypothetical protein